MASQTIRSWLWDVVDQYRQPTHSPRNSPSDREDREVDPQRQALRKTAQETLEVLSGLLDHLDISDEAHCSEKITFRSANRLHPSDCPRFSTPATIKVINDDTLNVAVRLYRTARDRRLEPGAPKTNPRPMIINFASHRKPGGGWMNGAMAQEESLCYRSSLALSLHRKFYPLALDEAIYSPHVLVMRGDMAHGHTVLDSAPADLPVVSGMTIAALHRPILRTLVQSAPHRGPYGHTACGQYRSSSASRSPPRRTRQIFARDRDRQLTKSKMRLVLRTAAANRHDMLVLGALGCGVYANPPAEIARCWLEVLNEQEFGGNWWREVCFAIYDPKNEGNYATFERVLAGKKV